jgi:hypothetical protein
MKKNPLPESPTTPPRQTNARTSAAAKGGLKPRASTSAKASADFAKAKTAATKIASPKTPATKTASRKKSPLARTSKTARRKPAATSSTKSKDRSNAPRLLSGGNPQIAKSDGDGPVQAYLDAVPGWKQDICRRLDRLIVRHVPNVRKAVRWNSPFYGIEGQGWLLSFHVYTRFVKVAFFSGAALKPPPAGGKDPDARWFDVYEDGQPGELHEAQFVDWLKQSTRLPGWGKV